MAHCTEPTPLALDIFQSFSSNSAKFSVIVQKAVGMQQLFVKITHSTEPWMPVGWKILYKILFFCRKVHNFQMVIIGSRT